MPILATLRTLSRDGRAAFVASLLGWTLDAFDFFLLVFVVKAIADDFQVGVQAVTFAILLTLAMRPVGALVFGRLADRYGRRPILAVNVAMFSVFELASAFAPNLAVLLVLRALFGFAMGGEWGVGASLTMESVPPQSRGVVSGILQQGYAMGYLLAAAVYYGLFELIGWRGMFAVGVLPALLALYIRLRVKESPVWTQARARGTRPALIATLKERWKLLVYVVVLMTAFNFLSHGTQDLYPTFLQVGHGLSPHAVGLIAAVYSCGAILGGVLIGAWSERVGRRRAIVSAALAALLAVPLWAYASEPVVLAAGAFVLQFFVQGAWGVIPAHLNELSPGEVRGTFPGVAYQLGNLLASINAPLQAGIAASHGGNYGLALAAVAGAAAIAVALLAASGNEAKGSVFAAGA